MTERQLLNAPPNKPFERDASTSDYAPATTLHGK
ncbi:MAG: hypothetical protein QOE33_8 [Acidobacteriota bacterium]|nr:hypothetical protein [Acidobacteriota bacterium]